MQQCIKYIKLHNILSNKISKISIGEKMSVDRSYSEYKAIYYYQDRKMMKWGTRKRRYHYNYKSTSENAFDL